MKKNRGMKMPRRRERAVIIKRAANCLIKEDGSFNYPQCGGCDDQGFCTQLRTMITNFPFIICTTN